MQVFGEWAQVEVVELVNDGSGLAFGIVGGRSSGVVVKSVLPGGVADRDGRLHPGDMLLRIGSVSVVGMCARQAAAVLRQCGTTVRLVVARPATDYGNQSLGASQAPIVPSRFLTEPAELERRLAETGHEGFGELYEDNDSMTDNHPTIIEERHLMRPVASIVAVVPRGAIAAPQQPKAPRPAQSPISAPMRLPLDCAVRPSPETESYSVELNKDSALGLGITVAGYVCEQEELSGIFVKSISEGSSAHHCGKIQVNDRIVEVDGVSLNGVSNHKAVSLLRDAKGPIVKLKALRYLRGAGFEKLQRALAAQDGRLIVAPPSPSVTSLSKFNFSVYEESTVVEPVSPSPRPTSPASPSPRPTSPTSPSGLRGGRGTYGTHTGEEEIRGKWADMLREDTEWLGICGEFDVVVGTITREKNTGLGISLEGTVKVVGGKEIAARHYIRAIAPNGPVAKLGVHRVGDELLEVNGWRVLGAHHVEVVSRLKAAVEPVTLVCARMRREDETRTIFRNNVGGSLQELLHPPMRLIKSKSESSVNSICDTGTITDIQHDHNEFCIDDSDRTRSRSLEPLSGLAMWSDQIEYVDLVKGDRGLGFSILDYMDPMDPSKSVIVVRGVADGGAAGRTGRVAAGDRLVAVGGTDVRGGGLSGVVGLLRGAGGGIVTIGISKPLPCSTVVGGHNGNDSMSSQECLNSITSDDQTNLDSYHECLQEYGEGLEVVHICLDEDPSIREEASAVDFSFEEKKEENMNGGRESKDSVEYDDLTITEDFESPRELPVIRKIDDEGLSKQQSKDISTSDEMVFAVTPTGLERINFDSYWDKNRKEINRDKDLSSKDSLNLTDTERSKQNNILFIDHDFEGYETCTEDDVDDKTDSRKPTSTENIKRDNKHDNVAENSAKNKLDKQKSINYSEDESSHGKPYVQEHIVKQMQSLHIEPLNINIGVRKTKKHKTKCVEYYNDQEECLKEYNRLKEAAIQPKTIEITKKEQEIPTNTQQVPRLRNQQISEESTDLECVSDCHRCFLENYAYEITKAYMDDSNCKYCAVIRRMLGSQRPIGDRRRSAPASFSLESSSSDDERGLMVPIVRDRRRSAEPLKFVAPARRNSNISPSMTVTVGGRGSIQQSWGPTRRVTLNRTPDSPLGVSIVGGKVDIVSSFDSDNGEDKTIIGIFIKNVVADSPAGNSGELHTGDRILEVDGACVRTASHERAVELIKAAGDTVTLTVQSLLAWNTDSSDVEYTSPKKSPCESIKRTAPPPPEKQDDAPEHEIKITVTSENGISTASEPPAPPDPEYSDSESSDEEDERQLSGRTYSDQGVEIDRASAAAMKRSKEEKENDQEAEDEFGYTTNKIRKKYASLGDSIVVVRLERSKTGLGLSLAGHRDRSRMAVFICGLNPTGSAAKASPGVKVGDEILEVNGIVLHGRCHLNASAIIKGLAGPVFKIILLRRKQALEDVAVKPLTQFPVQLEEEAEDKFAAYKGVRNVSIKKGTSSLGIMIIEGRHAEVGRGIFISDIQEGSAAEQAGLQIGDMILAVNKDSLLECTYDTAASTLKRSEGLVVLTVCNPNKKDAPSEDLPGSLGSKSRPTSRNQTPDPSLKTSGSSRPTTPKPAVSPAKAEPPADPATAQIQPNKSTVIEINTQNKSLGIILLGGSDTRIQGPAAVILEIYPGGSAAKDGRLQAGDQISEVCGTALTPHMSHERVCLTVKQNAPKLKMTVYRPSPIPFEDIEVELIRKSGKGLGLGVMQRTPAPGVYIAHVLPGSPADLDGRLQIGDIINMVDGKDLSSADASTAAAILKTAMPKANIKVKRFKIVR